VTPIMENSLFFQSSCALFFVGETDGRTVECKHDPHIEHSYRVETVSWRSHDKRVRLCDIVNRVQLLQESPVTLPASPRLI
jgi:hypothetical protein